MRSRCPPNTMKIALDYDGTYTADPTLWLRFILDAHAYGHEVSIVTMRFLSEARNGGAEAAPIDARLTALRVPIICTARQAKRAFCENIGQRFDVWIDDNPQAVDLPASAIWPGNERQEGRPKDPCFNKEAVNG